MKIDTIKEYLKDGVNLEELEKIISTYKELNSDNVKEYVNGNTSVFDSLVGSAVTKFKENYETKKSTEIENIKANALQEAKDTISKENQKTPEMIEIEQLKYDLKLEREAKELASIKSNLLNIIKKDNLSISGVDPFVKYGEHAETELRKYADVNKTLIDDLVKKQIADKFGKAELSSSDIDLTDNKPVNTTDFVNQSLYGEK